MSEFNEKYRERFMKLSTTNLSDAMDALGIKGYTYGIRPIVVEIQDKICGPAVTLAITSAGKVKFTESHLGIRAIEAAEPGDIIVVDNGGRLDGSCWGGILATGAKLKGIAGLMVDGAVRDCDDYVELHFPVYARGSVVATARGRIQEYSTQEPVQFAGLQVNPGDIMMGDRSGIVRVPKENIDEVLTKAETLFAKEEAMCAELRKGKSSLQVDTEFAYNKMLK